MSNCLYCKSSRLDENFKTKFHPFDKSHGPFNLSVCKDCGSLNTNPMPTGDELKEFYQRSFDGYPQELREAREAYPQDNIYKHYVNLVNKAVRPSDESFSWVDIGAGGGEFAEFFKKAHPQSKAHCVDFHAKPEKQGLKDVDWIQRDLNSSFDINQKFDVITSFAVLEHVLNPEKFMQNILKISHNQTTIVMAFPKYDSLLSKILGERWPFFIPGEHLTVPTTKGLRKLFAGNFKVQEISSTTVPYSLKYCLSYLKMKGLNAIIPGDLNLPVPAGLFKVVLKSS